MATAEKDLALALDTALLRNAMSDNEVVLAGSVDDERPEVLRSASTPRMRLEAAQMLAGKVGLDSHSPSEANLMDEIFKGGAASFNSISSDFDNQQTLDEMDKILESLQSWRDHRPEGEDSEGEDSEDEEYRAQRELYLQRQSQGLGEEDAPLTARHANEKTMESLSLLVLQGAKHCADMAALEDEAGGTDQATSRRTRSSDAGGRGRSSETDLLFRRIEQETRAREDTSLRVAEEKVCSEGAELESDMGALEALLRGFGSELDQLLLHGPESESAPPLPAPSSSTSGKEYM